MPASSQRHDQGAGLRLAALVGQRHVERVAAHAVAGHLGVDVRAARLGVLELLEHQHAGALADHEAVAVDVEGRDAPWGSSLSVLRARAAANPDTPTGLIGASLPPANMTSAAPSRMRRAA